MQRFRQQARRIDVRIAMDLAVAQKLGIFETRNQSQDARLLAVF